MIGKEHLPGVEIAAIMQVALERIAQAHSVCLCPHIATEALARVNRLLSGSRAPRCITAGCDEPVPYIGDGLHCAAHQVSR